MLRYRSHLRVWAARVLLLWMFGVGAGIANTCLAAGTAQVGGQRAADTMAVPASPADAATVPGQTPHAAPTAQHLDGACPGKTAGKTNCQDFCDKSRISIPPLKLALDHADAAALPAPPVAALCAVVLSEPPQRWVLQRDGGLAPPITIAYLRLAL